MKFLLCMLLTLATSMSARAMAFDWATDKGSEVENGYTIYAVLGDMTATWNSKDALVAASIGGAPIGTIAKDGRAYYASGTVSNSGIDKSHNFYLVIVKADSTQYASSQIYAASSYVYDDSAVPPETPPGMISFNLAGLGYTTFGTSPVPEPTSGLLVLVGLAGLMLRRKRA